MPFLNLRAQLLLVLTLRDMAKYKSYSIMTIVFERKGH